MPLQETRPFADQPSKDGAVSGGEVAVDLFDAIIPIPPDSAEESSELPAMPCLAMVVDLTDFTTVYPID
jgi:hypothetical protein